MHLTAHDLTALCKVAITAAKAAGVLIASYADKEVQVQKKEAGENLAAQVVTEVDLLSQDLILEHLTPSCAQYDLALLTEETADDGGRLIKDYFWCVDPLDGTLPFTESTPGYAVSLALVSQNGEPHIGVIYDPTQHTVYYAIKDQGAFKNGRAWVPQTKTTTADVFTFITDRAFLQDPRYPPCLSDLNKLARALNCKNLEIIKHGGAAMNAMWVLENQPACYFKLPKRQEGGGSLWDFSASACIFKEAGAEVSDVFGEPLDLNRADSTFMNHRGVYYAGGLKASAAMKSFFKSIQQT